MPAAVVEPTTGSESERCRARMRALRELPSLPGAPGLERKRTRLLASAKAEPVLFLRAPERRSGASAEVALYREQLARAEAPGRLILRLRKKLENRPGLARGVLLREGYLYAETPELGAALAEYVDLGDLFDEPVVFIERGAEVIRAVKGKHHYLHAEGERQGERAGVWLFDRVWADGDDPGPPLHRDLRDLVDSTGADQIRIEHLTREGAVASLRYGGRWVPALLEHEGARLRLGCEIVAPEWTGEVAATRERALRHRRVWQAQQKVIQQFIDESLPFDEPKTEEGQQDGNLRPKWHWAYEHEWTSYTFNEDTYQVFDPRGRPLVPQVCVDFVLDTIERASGRWWPLASAGRKRSTGRVDFGQLGLGNRRSVRQLVDFAWSHPELFDAYDLEPEERVRFLNREAFFSHLARHVDRYRPGDIVTIHGPRSDGELHYHSFFIYDADPLTGMPTLVAANAGKPRIRTWEREMQVAPERSIRSRLRPRLDWLEQMLPLTAPNLPGTPDPARAG